MIFLAILAIF